MPSSERAEEDSLLIERCRRGDAAAWQALVHRYAPLVHSFPVRYGLTPMEVEDVAQEVFLALALGLSQLEDVNRLAPWLQTTARRYSWRAVYKRKREQPSAEGDLAEIDPPSAIPLANPVPTMSELLAGWARQELIYQALEKLSRPCRKLLTLIFLDRDEPSYDQIAQQLTMSKGSIGPTRSRCLQQLRLILEKLDYRHSE